MAIDEKTFNDKSNIYMKVNDAYIPVEEVNELKNISYIQIFIQKIKELVKSLGVKIWAMFIMEKLTMTIMDLI